ncbi:MAG: metallophosphoesterase [Candidatus Poribacteria bacterium]|nr:MAG: metallophosphoesterase [Candidatus Poribacteria bacterium]
MGYGGDPEAVVAWLREASPAAAVRGNHDKVVAGIEEPEGFSPHARLAALRTRELLSPEALQYLATLPQGPVVTGKEAAICHGSWQDEDAYVLFPQDAAAVFAQMETRVLFFGHTHRACLYVAWNGAVEELIPRDERPIALSPHARYLINPGSVGQPRDGDPRAAYLLFDTEQWTVQYFRAPYDIERAQRRILKAGLPAINAYRLAEGR